MVPQLQHFIEKHIDLITNNKWFELYELAAEQIPFQVGHMSTSLIDAGVNPLEHIKRLPPYMFSNSMLTDFVIPDGVIKIGHQSFYSCYELKKVTIPRSVEKIYYTAFDHCYELEEIIYEGTLKELAEINPHISVLEDCKTTWIKCLDGIYDTATGEVIIND